MSHEVVFSQGFSVRTLAHVGCNNSGACQRLGLHLVLSLLHAISLLL